MTEVKILQSNLPEALKQIDMLENLMPKTKSCLCLLTEEMFSLCKELFNTDVLDFSINKDETAYTLCVDKKTIVSEDAREELLSISSSGKNDANKGIKGMVGAVLEMFAIGTGYEEADEIGTAWTYGLNSPGGEYAYLWTLSKYTDDAPQEEIEKNWDGMEKSIIANFADDVSIGVRTGKIEIKVRKNV